MEKPRILGAKGWSCRKWPRSRCRSPPWGQTLYLVSFVHVALEPVEIMWQWGWWWKSPWGTLVWLSRHSYFPCVLAWTEGNDFKDELSSLTPPIRDHYAPQNRSLRSRGAGGHHAALPVWSTCWCCLLMYSHFLSFRSSNQPHLDQRPPRTVSICLLHRGPLRFHPDLLRAGHLPLDIPPPLLMSHYFLSSLSLFLSLSTFSNLFRTQARRLAERVMWHCFAPRTTGTTGTSGLKLSYDRCEGSTCPAAGKVLSALDLLARSPFQHWPLRTETVGSLSYSMWWTFHSPVLVHSSFNYS